MLYGFQPKSRLLMGTAGYPSSNILHQAINISKTEIITVSIRREGKSSSIFRSLLQKLDKRILPNTAGCHTVKEAVTTAYMAREIFNTSWIKLEIVSNTNILQPDPFALVEATRILCSDDFQVFPYTTEDLVVADKLIEAGCKILMPWGAPIGSGQGLRHINGLRYMRSHFKDIPLIIDAGIGKPSQATYAMELGFDAVLLNTAIAKSHDPICMAKAFSLAISAGFEAFKSGIIEEKDVGILATPILGLASLN
jgi:thiazole synthase